MQVLVVDDEPAVREALGQALTLEAFGPREACDGTEAIRADAFDPGDRTAVLTLTTRDAVGVRGAGLEAGADDVLRGGAE